MRTTSLSILFTIFLLQIGISKICGATNDNEKITITGTVVDENNKSIIGSVVKLISGSVNTASVTDFDGKFTLSIVPEGGTFGLTVSYIGCKTLNKSFYVNALTNSKGTVKVRMLEDTRKNKNKNSSIIAQDFSSHPFKDALEVGIAKSKEQKKVQAQKKTATPASSSSYDFMFKNPTVPSSSTTNTTASTSTTKSRNATAKQTKSYSPQKRIALIIGNGDYANGPLMNPVNDAKDMRAKLQQLGFEVMGTTNVESKGKMREQVRDFCSKAKNYDAALFFYSGHARQDNGVNYLIPTRCDIRSEADIEDQCLAMNWVVKSIQDTGAKNVIVLLDACRNSPPIASLTRDSGYSGLADMSVMNGTVIGYATRPGMVASDGRGQRNSPYTAALLKTLDIPGLPHHEFFQRVRKLVAEATGRQQIPTENMLLIDNFIFNLNQ